MKTPSRTAPSPILPKLAGFAGAYAVLILVGRLFSPGGGYGPWFWPAPGFLTAGLLICPPRHRARLFTFAMAAGLVAYLAAGKSIPAATGFWLSDLAEAALALYLALRIPGGPGFLNDLSGTVRFFTQVVPAGAACGAVLRASSSALFLGTEWSRPLAVGFLAGAAGLAVLVPAVLSWAQRDQAWEAGTARHFRFALCAALTLSVG
jgi:hypothetical protein